MTITWTTTCTLNFGICIHVLWLDCKQINPKRPALELCSFTIVGYYTTYQYSITPDKVFFFCFFFLFFFNRKVLVFFLFLHKKTYVVELIRTEALLMSIHNICFNGEIRKKYVDTPLIWSYETAKDVHLFT